MSLGMSGEHGMKGCRYIDSIYKELHSKFLVIDRYTETVSWLTVQCIQCFNYNSFLGFFQKKMKSNLITLVN